MASYYVITSNAKGDQASPFTGDTAQLVQMTEQELQQVYRDSGQIQDHFGSFQNYMTYIGESQDWVQSAEWMNATVEYTPEDKEWLYQPGEDAMWRPGEREDVKTKIDSDLIGAKRSAYYSWLNEGAELMDKWGLNRTIYNSDGDQFQWTGSGYQKTLKVDDHPSFGDYAKAIVTTAVTAAATFGVAGTAAGASLTNFFTSAGLSQAAATAATSSIISSGIGVTLGQDVTAESLLVNALGAGLGAEVAGLANLSGAAGAALSSTVNAAVVQGIMEGELDFGDLLQAGFLGGATAVGSDLFTAMVEGKPFTFGGLIDENDSLYTLFNGDPKTGDTGWVGDIRGSFDKFTSRYIKGGEYFVGTSDSYKDMREVSPGVWEVTDWNGETKQMSFVDLVKEGFATIPQGGAFDPTTGDSYFWDLISKSTDAIPEEWYDKLYDYLTTQASGGGGSYSSEGGNGTTTITPLPTNETTDPDDFDCSSVNRQQKAGATTGTECGPCIDGFQPDVDGVCVEGVTEQCPGGQVWNDITFECEDEVFFEEGQPCNTEDGTQGTFNADGECVVSDGTGDGDGDGTGDGTGVGTDGGTGGACKDPNRLVTETGECSDSCRSGYALDTELDECVPSTVGPSPNGCEEGEPSTEDYGGYTFSYQYAYREWINRCGETTCQDGTPKSEDPNCNGNQPVDGEQCTTDEGENGSYQGGVCVALPVTPETPETCADGSFPEDYEDGKCPEDLITAVGDGDGEDDGEDGDTDCTLVECDAPRPEGEAGVAWDECCSDLVVDLTPNDGETDCTFVECDSPRPDAETDPNLAAAWDECCTGTVVPPSTSSSGSSGGGGNSGGRGSSLGQDMFNSNSISMGGDPQLLATNQFPITDFLAQVFKPKKPQNNGGGMLT